MVLECYQYKVRSDVSESAGGGKEGALATAAAAGRGRRWTSRGASQAAEVVGGPRGTWARRAVIRRVATIVFVQSRIHQGTKEHVDEVDESPEEACNRW